MTTFEVFGVFFVTGFVLGWAASQCATLYVIRRRYRRLR